MKNGTRKIAKFCARQYLGVLDEVDIEAVSLRH